MQKSSKPESREMVRKQADRLLNEVLSKGQTFTQVAQSTKNCVVLVTLADSRSDLDETQVFGPFTEDEANKVAADFDGAGGDQIVVSVRSFGQVENELEFLRDSMESGESED